MKVICIKTFPNRIRNDLFVENTIYSIRQKSLQEEIQIVESHIIAMADRPYVCCYDTKHFEYLHDHIEKKLVNLL